jgi:hypothetical protein
VIPVEVTQTPWHFTTVPDALDHWQTALAGFAALLAAFIAVVVPEWRARKALRAAMQGQDVVYAEPGVGLDGREEAGGQRGVDAFEELQEDETDRVAEASV